MDTLEKKPFKYREAIEKKKSVFINSHKHKTSFYERFLLIFMEELAWTALPSDVSQIYQHWCFIHILVCVFFLIFYLYFNFIVCLCNVKKGRVKHKYWKVRYNNKNQSTHYIYTHYFKLVNWHWRTVKSRAFSLLIRAGIGWIPSLIEDRS